MHTFWGLLLLLSSHKTNEGTYEAAPFYLVLSFDPSMISSTKFPFEITRERMENVVLYCASRCSTVTSGPSDPHPLLCNGVPMILDVAKPYLKSKPNLIFLNK